MRGVCILFHISRLAPEAPSVYLTFIVYCYSTAQTICPPGVSRENNDDIVRGSARINHISQAGGCGMGCWWTSWYNEAGLALSDRKGRGGGGIATPLPQGFRGSESRLKRELSVSFSHINGVIYHFPTHIFNITKC